MRSTNPRIFKVPREPLAKASFSLQTGFGLAHGHELNR
jgi:hypothetical protein